VSDMTLDQLDEFVSRQATIVQAPEGSETITFTSGGAEQTTWCESEAKAIELFAYEFANWIKRGQGSVAIVSEPEVLIWDALANNNKPNLEMVRLYTVSATLAWIAFEEADDAAA